jgi:3-mercaptopropionate dioxygenase
MTSASPAPATAAGLSDVVSTVRAAVRQGGDWAQTARLVAGQLRLHLPDPDILTEAERRGDPAGYRSHLLHTEPDGSFSVLGVVWLPGQVTPVHDHVTWCAFGVLQGSEREELFTLADDGRRLVPAAITENTTGQVSGFAPPGDIHRVCNSGAGVTISLYVYGADISRLGSSVRREYHLPIG